MFRRLFTFPSVVSLALCVATAFLWVVTARSAGGIAWSTSQTYVECYAEGGELRATQFDAPPGETFYAWSPHRYAEETSHALYTSGHDHTYSVTVPLLVLALLLLIGAAVGYRPLWRRSRSTGEYVNCGDDMRASPVRCPECGTSR